jgi:hypothetical protein
MVNETIDQRVARLQEQLRRKQPIYDSDIEWLCRELLRARAAIVESLENYDDTSRRHYLGLGPPKRLR